MYKILLSKFEECKGETNFGDLSRFYFSHIFQSNKDIYMTALLKEILQSQSESLLKSKKSVTLTAFVGAPHFEMIKKYWDLIENNTFKGFKHSIPKRIINESDEDLIEKQALFDVCKLNLVKI